MTKQCIQTQLKNVIRMMYNTIIFKLSSKSIYNTIIFKINRIWKVQSESNRKMWGSVKSFMNMKPPPCSLASLISSGAPFRPCPLDLFAPLISSYPKYDLFMKVSCGFHEGFMWVSSRFRQGCGFHQGFMWV